MNNMKKLLFFFFIVILEKSFCQEKLNIDLSNACNYYGEEIKGDVYGFTTTQEALEIIDEMLQTVGLKRNFIVKAASVPNAEAVIYGTNRYILYSQSFISNIKLGTDTDWSAISVLAHEVGHHLNGHTLIPGGSRPPTELEADEFSGYILYLMDCPSLPEAQAAMNLISNELGSATHPPKAARLEAIAIGWQRAKEKFGSQKKKKPPRTEEIIKPIEEKIESTPIGQDASAYMTVDIRKENKSFGSSGYRQVYGRRFIYTNNSDWGVMTLSTFDYGFWDNCIVEDYSFLHEGTATREFYIPPRSTRSILVESPKLIGKKYIRCPGARNDGWAAIFVE